MTLGPLDTPVVSVVMPVRNEEAAIGDAVRSVLAQSYPRLEVLAWTDAPRTEPRGGPSTGRRGRPGAASRNPARVIPAALNVGLAAATGPLLARIEGTPASTPTTSSAESRRSPPVRTWPASGAAASASRAPLWADPSRSRSPAASGSATRSTTTVSDPRTATTPRSRFTARRWREPWRGGTSSSTRTRTSTSITVSAPSATGSPTTPAWRSLVRARGPGLARPSVPPVRARQGSHGPQERLGALAARHLAPPALLAVVTLAALAAVLGRPCAAVAMGAPYALVVGGGTTAAWMGRPREEPVSLPALPPPSSRCTSPGVSASSRVSLLVAERRRAALFIRTAAVRSR